MAKPRVILADEMSLGLAPVVVRRLMDVVAELGRQGTGVLLIEQFASATLAISARAYVMHRGRVSYEGDAADLATRPDVLDAAYLGTDPATDGPARP